MLLRFYFDGQWLDCVDVPEPKMDLYLGLRLRVKRGGLTQMYVVAEVTDEAVYLESELAPLSTYEERWKAVR